MKSQSALLALTLSCTLGLGDEAVADVTKARLGRQMFVAFQCATFAELSGEDEEHQRLFQLGITTGRAFLRAARNNEISEEEASQNIPWVVMLLLGGPSDDFMLGRMFETAMQDAYDKVIKKSEDGSDLPISDWRVGAFRKAVAEDKYNSANCDIVR
jgi:hypothetical protein